MLKKYRVRHFAAIIFTLLVISASAYSQRLGTRLSGSQETPPNGSAGTGYGHVILSADLTTITVDMGFNGLGTAATAAHIHTAPFGVPGPVTFPLAGVPAATSGVIPQQTFAISPAQLADLMSGNMYFNVHTSGFPGGEIRGQLILPACDTASAVEVHATAGTMGPTGYTELNLAFAAINAGTHQGAIDVEVCGNTTETASAALNSGAVAPAVYTSVNVFPVGAARTVTGSIVGAVIKLNGADNVTIDGRIGGVGTNRDLTVSNTSTGTATAAVWLSSLGPGLGAMNNVIRNLELKTGIDPTSSSSVTMGIIMSGTTISTTSNGDDNDNNQFIFNRITKARYGIVTRGVTTNNNLNPIVTDNIIGPTAFGTDQINKTGILMQADTGAIVSRNTVQFVGCLEPQACTGTDRVGIGIGSESWSSTDSTTITSMGYTVTKNIVHDIAEENTFSTVGIKLSTTQSGGATNNLVANNFIYNIRANGTAGDQLCGIGISGGNGDQIVNNSISISGDMDPGISTSSSNYGNAIRIPGANAANNANFIIRNNSIYLDVNSNTATVHFYAITLNSVAYTFGTGGLNFNNDYVNPANPQLFTGGVTTTSGGAATTEYLTLANWQAAIAGQEVNSIQANPLYASITTDPHLTGVSPNINVGTAIAAVPDDIDNEARPNGAAYDIGADEFYPLPGVLQLSSATYGANEGATLVATVNRVMGSSGTVGATATLTDGSATGGAACGAGVDYVNPGPQLLSFADSVTSQPVNVMLCTDAVTDPSEMFTITLSLPTGGATLGSPTVATATITDVPPPFAGSYNVGAAQTYTSLTNPGGIFEAINLGGASGPVTINITSDLTGETGSVPLNPITGSPTVLIKPSGAPRTISGIASIAVIRINGADNIRLDGSTTAMLFDGVKGDGDAESIVGGTPALRQLTVQNLNTAAGAAAVIALHSNTDGAQNNRIQNVNILGNDPTQTLIGVSMGGNTVGTVGTDNDGNRIVNCSVRRAFFGIYSAGVSAANQNTGTVIQENDLSGTTVDRIRRVGILVFNDDGIQIVENSVGGLNTNESADGIGIGVGTQSADTTNVTSGNVTNALVTRNKINGVNSASTVGFSAAGIAVSGGTTGANVISNNMITGVTAPATSPDIVAGIYVVGAVGSSTRLYHNSVAMTGDRDPAVAGQMPSYGVAITGVDPTVELKNNIFYTTQTASGGGVNAVSYAIGMVTTTFVNLDSNYNDFWSAGANDGGFRTGSLATAAGTSHVDLTAWTTATGDDAAPNSQEVDPVYVNPLNDLHLNGSTSPLLGDGITGFATVDHDNDPRPAAAPEIGADELVQSDMGSFPAGTFYNAITAPNDLMSGNVTITNSITLNGILNTGNLNTLTLGCNASFANAGTSNYVVGTVNKDYCGPGLFVYPVGTTPDGMFTGDKGGDNGMSITEYTPVTANITALGTVPSSLSARVFDNTLAPFDPAQSLSRNWDLRETGDLTADLSFTYLPGTMAPGDVNGTESDYRVWRRSTGGVLTNLCPGGPCVNTMTSTIGPVTGVTLFSRWTGAGPAVPTAAGVDVSGRVLTPDGAGLRNAIVTLTDVHGVTQTARSSSFGNYRFEGIRVGETYILAVNSRRYLFTPRAVQVLDEVTGLDITADGEQ